MTIQAIKTNRTDYLKKIRGGVFCLLCLFTLLCGMSVWGGTVTLMESDAYAETAIRQGGNWSDGEPPHSDADYVVPDGLSIRTSNNLATGERVFEGKSLTLQSGATLVTKHVEDAVVRIPDLRLEGGSIVKEANGGDNGFLEGTFSILGTVENPVRFIGTGEVCSRWIKMAASLTSENTAAVKIGTSDKAERKNNEFHVELRGDSSGYKGRFVCEANRYHDVGLAVQHENALGTGGAEFPVVKLTKNGAKYDATLWGLGGYKFNKTNYNLEIDDGATIGGMTADGDGNGLYFDGGVQITGSGTLRIKKWKGAYDAGLDVWMYPAADAAVVFKNVTIANTVTLTVSAETKLVLGEGYANADVPVTVEKGGSLTIACPTLTAAGNGALVTTGVITKDAADKIKITFDPVVLCKLNAGTIVNILSASNLGTDGGLTLEDFVFDVAWAKEFAAAFSITENELIFTRPAKSIVFKTGTDSGSTQSWAAKHNWSNNQAPGTGNAYVVDGSGKVLRTPEPVPAAAFAGDYLVVQNWGWLSIVKGTATVNDFRMGSGGVVRPVRDLQENNLAGRGTVYASRKNPFRISFEGGNWTNWRKTNIPMELSGSGDLLFVYVGKSVTVDGFECARVCSNTNESVTVTGENVDFTGGITIEQPQNKASSKNLVVVDFANETAMGGPANEFRADRLKFVNNPTLQCSASYGMNDATRGITFENGVTFKVLAGQTLTVGNVMTGYGTITKTGTGTLALTAANTMTDGGAFIVEEGCLTLGDMNAINTRPLTFGVANSDRQTTLRIASAEGVYVKPNADTAFVQAGTVKPELEVAAFDALRGKTATARLFRYRNAEALEAQAFAAKFELAAFPSSGNYKLEWGTETISEGEEYAVTLTVKPTGFAIFVR